MFTIENAFKGTKEAAPLRTLRDLKVGEAFKWARLRDSGDVWCARVGTNVGGVFKDNSNVYWMPLEGRNAGYIYTDYTGEREEVLQP